MTLNLKTLLIYAKALGCLVLLYLGIIVFMYFFQRNFTFQPSHENPFNMDHAPFQPFTYQTPLGLTLRGLYYPAQPGKPTIIYFQGNAGHIGDRLFKTKTFLSAGYGFALVGYRGYSGNPGSPTEKGVYDDARAAIRKIESTGVPINNMILYGESLGTGIATQMATEFPQAKALILEAPFTSAVTVAEGVYWFLPVSWLMKDVFDSSSKIKNVQMPILIYHGNKDRTIPFKLGRSLFDAVTSKTKEFVTIEGGGHADLYDLKAGDYVRAFVDKL
jgi:uncharacterized protein